MNTQKLREQVRAAFNDVESAEFLDLQIEKGIDKHRRNFLEYIAKYPDSNFEVWRKQTEQNVNTNICNSEEAMAIGIFLLSLDEMNHENL